MLIIFVFMRVPARWTLVFSLVIADIGWNIGGWKDLTSLHSVVDDVMKTQRMWILLVPQV